MTPASILENELVKKYFKCECYLEKRIKHGPSMINDCMSAKVLAAMQQPIQKGELVLLQADGTWVVTISTHNERSWVDLSWHPYWLRLPDAFQPKPDSAVEEQIKKMAKQFQPRIDGYENALRELVRLARAKEIE